ncbi:MAG: hypothetical protein FWF30_00075 [Coriobacteriia bacterium]|nr:hypothetical protein [Coriobacteriia bacterium]
MLFGLAMVVSFSVLGIQSSCQRGQSAVPTVADVWGASQNGPTQIGGTSIDPLGLVAPGSAFELDAVSPDGRILSYSSGLTAFEAKQTTNALLLAQGWQSADSGTGQDDSQTKLLSSYSWGSSTEKGQRLLLQVFDLGDSSSVLVQFI